MKRGKNIISVITGQRGTVIVYIGILILVLIGFAALAVDIGHLYVARNELQNAADSGALAGAQVLYNPDGTAVNPNANQTALAVATANLSQNSAVEVNADLLNNSGDIERGHWSFTTRQFTRSEPDNLSPPQLWDYTTLQLDTMTTFVNAVRVVTKRETTPVAMTFARIFGFPTYPVRAEAIAYIGFAGSLAPGEVDWPLAICLQAILSNGSYSCVTGREINSGAGGGGGGHNTAAYTNYTQPCATTNPAHSPGCVGNSIFLGVGAGMGATNGADVPIYRDLYDCWKTKADKNPTDGIPDTPWVVTLPVVDCGDDLMIGNCMPLLSAVTVTILWMETDGGTGQVTYPRRMGDWTCPSEWTDSQCFNNPTDTTNSDFVHYFNIKDWEGIYPSTPAFRSIYFKPDCAPHELAGGTGGINSGILAKRPVLVAPPQN